MAGRRLALAAVTAAFVLSTGSPALADISAIQPGNSPTAVPGASNGRMPAADLIGVAPGCLAYRPAASSLGLLLAAARDSGLALGTEQCYRSLAGQEQEQAAWTAAGNSACAAPVATGPGGPVGTSMHGWGKAVDFEAGGVTVGFGSPAYEWLEANAGRYGWNHPGWAEPGGSACPEAWHWEWVGDGGTDGGTSIRAEVVGLLPGAGGQGYATVTGLGALGHHGTSPDFGSAAGLTLADLVTGAVPTPDGRGYWMVASDGGVFSFGDASFYGSMAGKRLAAPVVGMAATPDGRGYWLVAADGGVFSFGDATFAGSEGAMALGRPVVGMATTPDGRGYWLAAADGSVYPFGDAVSERPGAGPSLRAPVVSIAASPDGHGFWLASADGGVVCMGDAGCHGSMASRPLNEPVVGLVATPDGRGYWLVAADGGVFCFGDAGYHGSG